MSRPADRDMTRRVEYLSDLRGEAFADEYARKMVARLERLADTGVQLGTALGDDPRVRTFGYANHATVLARFGPEELLVMRVYFKGQDWRGPR
jgi:plasmid stabilization system protein ParE